MPCVASVRRERVNLGISAAVAKRSALGSTCDPFLFLRAAAVLRFCAEAARSAAPTNWIGLLAKGAPAFTLGLMRGLTFELSRARRQTPTGRGRTMTTVAWSGQAVAAVARRLERVVRPQRVTRVRRAHQGISLR
jgi:hypothetical protein